jgi:hypothetical protein
MTANLIATIVGILISVGLEVIPGIKEKWSKWKWKPLTLLSMFLLVPAALWVLACPLNVSVPWAVDCSISGLGAAVVLGLTAFGANQGVFSLVLRKRLPNVVKRNMEVV